MDRSCYYVVNRIEYCNILKSFHPDRELFRERRIRFEDNEDRANANLKLIE